MEGAACCVGVCPFPLLYAVCGYPTFMMFSIGAPPFGITCAFPVLREGTGEASSAQYLLSFLSPHPKLTPPSPYSSLSSPESIPARCFIFCPRNAIAFAMLHQWYCGHWICLGIGHVLVGDGPVHHGGLRVHARGYRSRSQPEKDWRGTGDTTVSDKFHLLLLPSSSA